ncbi:hypothetical protein [Thiomicrospira sp. ALE5]|uniref:hypothetical protein n=1 Tax=Thiomicrospira sp. ALE5 TaxID=748650 RepID=UPI0008E6B380|nr:hypothetical protein [Thiomicrospira sp. ALE5]SFR49946.1 hypothetical protein SAMN03092900_0265 [Thiomicrospira sp. ALE5]
MTATTKQQAAEMINNLPDNANWDDVVKTLIKQRKLSFGMSDAELLAEGELSDAEVSAIVSRLETSRNLQDDMRSTQSYKPGNATTLGMIAGVIAIVFAFVMPPISWLGAVLAVVAGGVGLSRREEKAWIPLLMAFISVFAYFVVLGSMG